MIVINEHDNHMTLQFLNYVTKHNILLFTFSSHSTHLTQSLNIEVFQLFKHSHTEEVDRAMRVDEVKFTKLNFFHLFSTMHAQIMILTIILHV